MIVILGMSWVIISYLACRIAYNQGRLSKFQEISREYIVLHKSVLIKREWDKKEKKSNKHLTKHSKKF